MAADAGNTELKGPKALGKAGSGRVNAMKTAGLGRAAWSRKKRVALSELV